MSWKSILIRPYASLVASNVRNWALSAIPDQQNCLNSLLKQAGLTSFGKSHNFKEIKNYSEFKSAVPLRNYEDFKPWLDRIFKGEINVLWPGMPLYFAESSGTTSGIKYIPISRESISHHFKSAQAASILYLKQSNSYSIMDGKMLFLSGSPKMELLHKIPTGRLSGIVNHHIPNYLSKNKLPAYTTNCIADWEQKLDAIVAESINQDLRLIGGIPPWMQMYFDYLTQKTGKSILQIFPNLKLLVHGGVNFEPYRKRMEESLGGKVNSIDTYPCSEAFIAFQDDYTSDGLLLNTKAGIFYEFIPLKEIYDANPSRLSLAEVELDCQYAIVISTNAGLWAYILGDTIRFVSLNPFKIKITGRTKHFISAFGEHVIAEEVEHALTTASKKFSISIEEFTVAPNMGNAGDLPFHEWIIAGQKPGNDTEFAQFLDKDMCKQNIYYKDLIEGKVIQSLKIKWVSAKVFHLAMKKMGKLGGQNKSPRLMNDRSFADLLLQF